VTLEPSAYDRYPQLVNRRISRSLRPRGLTAHFSARSAEVSPQSTGQTTVMDKRRQVSAIGGEACPRRTACRLSLNPFHPGYASRICNTWMALASCPARYGQQRSLRRILQVLSWAFARSPGARSFAWARLAAFWDSGLFFPMYGSSRGCCPGSPYRPGQPARRPPARPARPGSTARSCRAPSRAAPRTPRGCPRATVNDCQIKRLQTILCIIGSRTGRCRTLSP
jgi:hypothetical protein